MKVAVAIGSYRMPQFVELNIRACHKFFGDETPILVSDSQSPESSAVAAVAKRLGVDYEQPEGRRSHFNGDMCATVAGLRYAAEVGAEAAVKLSQRLVPCAGAFVGLLEQLFHVEQVALAVPGRPIISKRFRPRGLFYSRFPILTDVLALRLGAIQPDELWGLYAERVERHCRALPSSQDKRQARLAQHVEVFWWDMLNSRFSGRNHVVPEWANPRPMQPKLCLRKTQSTAHEYERLAETLGMPKAVFDLREWSQIEKGSYYCYASKA